ncbi:MAG: MBL fold metallo-hydrolase [Tissierellia bacterium]|nr:MBL fold metallo-hydrolase [Tissierellia bacterium]
MKIIVLSDNRTLASDFESEHGLCIYIETDRYKCLLDTGASDVFIRNAHKMNLDLREVDYVFISHGHADHIGGLSAFLKINNKAKIIVSPFALNQEFYSKRVGLRKISVDINFDVVKDRLIRLENEAYFENEIHVFKNEINKYSMPQGNRNLFKDKGKGMESDDFDHELIVTFGNDNLFVYTGCGHKGLLNILESVKAASASRISYVMGGFHLLDAQSNSVYESETEIEDLAGTLNNDFPHTNFITGHCTGEQAFHLLKKTLGLKLIQFYTSYKLKI